MMGRIFPALGTDHVFSALSTDHIFPALSTVTRSPTSVTGYMFAAGVICCKLTAFVPANSISANTLSFLITGNIFPVFGTHRKFPRGL